MLWLDSRPLRTTLARIRLIVIKMGALSETKAPFRFLRPIARKEFQLMRFDQHRCLLNFIRQKTVPVFRSRRSFDN
jgi:hypothetical protein